MKLFWRSVYGILGLLVFIVVWDNVKPDLWFAEKTLLDQHQLTQPKNLDVSLAYQFIGDQWLTFSLVSNGDVVKVITNAVLPSDYSPVDGEKWGYALEYQIINNEDQVLLSGDIFHKTSQKIYFNEQLGQRYVASTYFPPDQNPVDARLHLINVRGLAHAKKIRLRLKDIQSPIENVILRFYQKAQISEDKLTYLWQRIGDEKRNKLAGASVYQQDLLTDNEKNQLLLNQWSASWPLNDNDKSYVTKKLYVAHDAEEDVVVNLPEVPPEGLLVYPNKYGVVSVPVFSGKVKLQWQPLLNGIDDGKVTIEWWGHPATKYKQFSVDISKGEFISDFESGVLQLSGSSALVFRIWIDIDNKNQEITPEKNSVRLYKPTEKEISYTIHHQSNKSTPFRVDVRCEQDDKPHHIQYRLLNDQHQTVKLGRLSSDCLASRYSMVVGDVERVLSEPTSFYFNIPTSITRIDFAGDDITWLTAYTRPIDYPLQLVFPYQFERVDANNQQMPTWYFVRPLKWKDLIANGDSILLNVQSSPPDIDPMIMAGQYKWDQFFPLGNWRGRELLTVSDDGLPFRQEALSARYTEVQLNQKLSVDIQGYEGEETVETQLIVLQNNNEANVITVTLDDKLLYTQKIYTKDSDINLPPVSPGRHSLKIQAEKKASVFINHVIDAKINVIKRMAVKLEDKSLEFDYLKEDDEELIALRVYPRDDENFLQQIKVQIDNIGNRSLGPFKNWSIANRVYFLSKNDGDGARALQSKDQDLAPSRLLFIPLGEDLDNNKTYHISFKLTKGPVGYSILTRTLPGGFDRRVIERVPVNNSLEEKKAL